MIYFFGFAQQHFDKFWRIRSPSTFPVPFCCELRHHVFHIPLLRSLPSSPMWHLSSHNYSLGRLYRFRDPKLEDRFQADINKWSAYNTQPRQSTEVNP